MVLPALVTTVYDPTMANYGLERGLNDENCVTVMMIPKHIRQYWAESSTGVRRGADHPWSHGSSPITRTKRTGVQ